MFEIPKRAASEWQPKSALTSVAEQPANGCKKIYAHRLVLCQTGEPAAVPIYLAW